MVKGLISDTFDDVSDPSDWKSTKFPNLAELDDSLRCQICKDFLKAPVLTTCGHIFCSICIRRTISENNKCPICLVETYESGLRKILLLDNIINWFTSNRSDLMKNLEIDEINDSQDEECNANNNIQVKTSNTTSPRQPEDDNLAECPVCGVFMTLDELQNSHIDKCLQNPSKPKNESNSIQEFFNKPSNIKTQTKYNNQLQPIKFKNKQRLPNVDTSLTTSKLKEKMNNFNIPTNGTRVQLENRFREFINLYNANLDSINPVNDRILIERLKKWDSLISTNNTHSTTHRHSPPLNCDQQTIKRQKLDHDEWNTKNKEQYYDLIKMAKRNMKKTKSEKKGSPTDEEGHETNI